MTQSVLAEFQNIKTLLIIARMDLFLLFLFQFYKIMFKIQCFLVPVTKWRKLTIHFLRDSALMVSSQPCPHKLDQGGSDLPRYGNKSFIVQAQDYFCYHTMEKLELTGQSLVSVFNFRCARSCACRAFTLPTKTT